MPSADDRILHWLKSRGPQPTEALARQLGISLPGVRKHLSALLAQGLLAFTDRTGAVGRPRRLWRLTAKADARFPDNHAFLTVEMIEAAREVYGEDGLDRLIARRERQTLARYCAALDGLPGLGEKVARLCQLRSEEGYMAEWSALAGGSFLLAENHCPICAAARACQGFCRSELDVFRRALGEDVAIERTDHILAGARRCAYLISSRPQAAA